MSGHQLGTVGLDVPKSLKATKHRDEQSTCLDYTAAYRFADFGKNLNLVSVWRSNYTDEARDLNSSAAMTLRQPEPRGVSLF